MKPRLTIFEHPAGSALGLLDFLLFLLDNCLPANGLPQTLCPLGLFIADLCNYLLECLVVSPVTDIRRPAVEHLGGMKQPNFKELKISPKNRGSGIVRL